MKKIFLSIIILVAWGSSNLFGINNTNSEKRFEDEFSGLRVIAQSVFSEIELEGDSFYAEIKGLVKHIYVTDNLSVNIRYSLDWQVTKVYIDPKYNNSKKPFGFIITLGYGDLFFLCVKTKNEFITRFYDDYYIAKDWLDLY